jgi:hypothetical protein
MGKDLMQLAIDHWLREAAQPTSPANSHPGSECLSEIAFGDLLGGRGTH